MGRKSPFDALIDACAKGESVTINTLLNSLPNRGRDAINCLQKVCKQ